MCVPVQFPLWRLSPLQSEQTDPAALQLCYLRYRHDFDKQKRPEDGVKEEQYSDTSHGLSSTDWVTWVMMYNVSTLFMVVNRCFEKSAVNKPKICAGHRPNNELAA